MALLFPYMVCLPICAYSCMSNHSLHVRILPLIFYFLFYFTTPFPAVNCGDPGTPSNGRRTGSSTTYNSVVTYTCNTGYTRQGSNRRTCQSNGQWSGSLPQCNRKFCVVLIVFLYWFYILSLFLNHKYIYNFIYIYIYIIHSNSRCENSSPCTAGDPSFSHV